MKGRVYTADVGTAAPSAIRRAFRGRVVGFWGRTDQEGGCDVPAAGTAQTRQPEQIRELDDTLLSSDPSGYFISRASGCSTTGRLVVTPGRDDEADAVLPILNDVAIGRPTSIPGCCCLPPAPSRARPPADGGLHAGSPG